MYGVLHLNMCVSNTHETKTFQVFQLTAIVMRGPATRGERFFINLDCVTIKEEVRGVLLCVQDFVRNPQFTQRTFISEFGWTMLSESVAIAESITTNSVYAPWSLVGTACAGQVASDLHACWDRLALRRRNARDTSQRWYHIGTPRSETASTPGVQILDVVDNGPVKYLPVALPAPGPPEPSRIRSSPSKRKRKLSQSPNKLPRNFEISSPPATSQKQSLVEARSFSSALTAQTSRGKSRRSIRDGFSIETVCCISSFAVFPSFIPRLTSLFIVLV